MLNVEIENAVREQARLIGMDEAALLAIVEVESGGEPFYADGKPVIRFEGHYFYARLKGKDRQQAVKAGLASPKVGGVPNPSTGQARYALLSRAMAINVEAALESTSWGLGQVMGANWKDLGRPDVQSLVADSETIQGQIDLMTDFIEVNGLDDEVHRRDWAAFARGYNGPAYKKNKYDVKLAKAYAKYSKKSSAAIAEDEVKKIQLQLNAVLGTKIAVDGDYGQETTNAVIAFQVQAGLTVDGLAGPLTKGKLAEAYAKKSKAADTAVGGASLGLGSLGTVISDATNMLEPLQEYSVYIKGLFIVLVFAGVFFTFKSFFWK